MAVMSLTLSDEQRALKAGVADICKKYPGEYWRDLDSRREYPEAFVTGYPGVPGGPDPRGVRGRLAHRRRALILETIH
jgi:hypothetical protein